MNDIQIRMQAFKWLDNQKQLYGDTLPWQVLKDGFIFQNERIHLVAQNGIFKPRIMDFPISIRFSPKGPYDDMFSDDGILYYSYQGQNPNAWDNVALRNTIQRNLPLIYFHGVGNAQYLSEYPVYIIGDNPENLTFKVAVDDMQSVLAPEASVVDEDARRRYITSKVKVRLHQGGFRERVLRAYQSQCALCRLKHIELLDAAHIIPDSDPLGKPEVTNGISLCKLHHAAFDSFIIGLTPDYTVEIREDVLDETDGPMLQHGLKELHKSKIELPPNENQWPNINSLEQRYQEFIDSKVYI